jgi:predicted cation transporter
MATILPEISAQPVLPIVAGLAALAAALLILPFRVRKIEENLEPFFLVVGIASVTVSGLWGWPVVLEALKAPIMIGTVPIGIVQVVLVMGLLIHYANAPFSRWILRLARKIGHRVFLFLLISMLGLLSSFFSVIVTAVLAAEIAVALPLSGKDRKNLTVVACFAAGLGACLSPLGEPLSTILISKLAGPPYFAGFFFPLKHFGFLMVPGVLALALLGALWIGPRISPLTRGTHAHDPETPGGVVLRALKIYMFIAALILIGEGFRPLMIWYISKIPPGLLYWVNMSSAVLDNATLTAIEVGPAMALPQIVGVVMGLSISGGMLIPGNIPNIVAAGRLKIGMKEWATVGLPLGFTLMTVYFAVLFLF